MEKFSYLNRDNLGFIEEEYMRFLQNPQTVNGDWRLFFEGIEFAKNMPDSGPVKAEVAVLDLIRAYREEGHLQSYLNPLADKPGEISELALARFGLKDEDLNQVYHSPTLIGFAKVPLREILQNLRAAYCGTLTVETRETDVTSRQWIIEQFENQKTAAVTTEQYRQILQQVTQTEALEKFLQTRFLGVKRFSIEGADAMIPMLHHLTEVGTQLGLRDLVFGMAHRGRINVLTNFMGKPVNLILAEFDGVDFSEKSKDGGGGDVKYHLGYAATRKTASGNCELRLAFNPSHLEFVNPVVEGMAWARHTWLAKAKNWKETVPLLIHGDAAFAGQGIVQETLQLSQLKGFATGGTIHLIIDNQVGFTTDPAQARSTRYTSDVAKFLSVPILHVNGDDMMACIRAMDLAIRYRQQFAKDVVIHLVCYRRYGHNEGDEPAFTQPLMYEKIKKHPTLRDVFVRELLQKQVITQEDADQLLKAEMDRLQGILEEVRKTPPSPPPTVLDSSWDGLRSAVPGDFAQSAATGVAKAKLLELGTKLNSWPADFHINKKLQQIIEKRLARLKEGEVDWAVAEILSYGTLLNEGYPVRLTGQDVERGTFSHRHAVWIDGENANKFCSLQTVATKGASIEIHNSLLSETAVLGFEYGITTVAPQSLVIWEAQFGDFANGAQVIIDQFLSSAEWKWKRMSGLVLLLPHGYEGQGPEHSSARLERFLALCAQNNIQVCNLTTPAQIFHAMRRQVVRGFRKPLIIMSPKSLLRHPKVVSSVDELSDGHFREVIPDPSVTDVNKVKTVVLCSGKIYYDLEDEKLKRKAGDEIALVRVEQLYPFPAAQLKSLLTTYKNVQEVVWAQEEPKNMGGYIFMILHFKIDFLASIGREDLPLRYVGRIEQASPATGSNTRHKKEQAAIVEEVFKARSK